MKKTNNKLFEELFVYWSKRLKVKKLRVRKDNRYDCYACIVEEYNKPIEVCYNSNNIYKIRKSLLHSIIFHEIGHLKYPSKYSTEKQVIDSEFKAEKFAIKMIKRYYPKEYKSLIRYHKKNIKKELYKKNYKMFQKAIVKIKDLQNF